MVYLRKSIAFLSVAYFLLFSGVSQADLSGSPTGSLGSKCERVISQLFSHNFLKDQIAKLRERSDETPSTTVVEEIDFLRQFTGRRTSFSPRSAPTRTEPISTRMNRGEKLHDIATELGIPPETLKFFNSKTGGFKYERIDGPALSKENGDAQLRAIRVNFEIYNKEAPEFDWILRDYSNVLQSILGLELWIITKQGDLPELQNRLAGLPKSIQNRIKIVISEADEIPVWAQDSSKPLDDGRGTLMQKDGNEVHWPAYYDMTKSLQTNGMADVRTSTFRFEGGNVIVGDRNVFVGPHIVRDVMEDFGVTRVEAIKALSIEFGKPVVEVGFPGKDSELQQVDFHIDLSMTMIRNHNTGKEVAFVQSPYRLLEDVMGFPRIDSLNQNSFRRAIEEYLLKVEREISDGTRSQLMPTEKIFIEEIVSMKLHEIQERELKLSAIAITLESNGYEVIRLPGRTRFIESEF